MAMRPSKLASLALVSILLLPLASFTQEQQPQGPDREPPDVFKTAPHLYRLGDVEINAKARTLSMPGKVNMQKGLVEVFACTPRGKRHESVLVVDVDPIYLQLGLLLLGLSEGSNPSCPGEEPQPVGGMMDIWVEWQVEGQKKVKRRAEELIMDLRTDEPMQRTHWVFLGSMVYEGRFLARDIGSLITTYHDATAIIENPHPSCKDDTLYEANPDVVPPVGTPVKVTISPVTEERSNK